MSKKSTLTMHEREIAGLAASKAAEAAIAIYNQQKENDIEESIDRRLRNTRLLLRKYRVFKRHAENAVFTEEDYDEQPTAFEVLGNLATLDGSLYIESISKSARRTKIIVDHIDTMFEVYKTYCKQCGKPEDIRRSEIIEVLYINEPVGGGTIPTKEDVAELQCIHPRTVDKDINAAVGVLSALIFGIDSIGRL